MNPTYDRIRVSTGRVFGAPCSHITVHCCNVYNHNQIDHFKISKFQSCQLGGHLCTLFFPKWYIIVHFKWVLPQLQFCTFFSETVFLLYFSLNKSDFGVHKRLISKTLKNFTNPKLLNCYTSFVYEQVFLQLRLLFCLRA